MFTIDGADQLNTGIQRGEQSPARSDEGSHFDESLYLQDRNYLVNLVETLLKTHLVATQHVELMKEVRDSLQVHNELLKQNNEKVKVQQRFA